MAARKLKPVVEDTLKPFVTVEDIMKVFSCQKDKAFEIMFNPDLKAFKVGRVWYVSRDNWDEFINNIVRYNGLINLSKGFYG